MSTILNRQYLVVNQKSYTQNRYDFRRFMHPRLCMVTSVGLILVGLSLPTLMVLEILPANLLLDFLGFGLVLVGSTLTLIKCGDI